MRRVLIAAALLVTSGAATAAQARVVQYVSQHPLPRKVAHGFCYIDVPHYHDFAPSDPRLYRQVGDQYYFVGDPAPFEYEGPRYSFYGPHPVVEAHVQVGQPIYCYLRGPHYHWYQPPAEASFELRGGAYWYVGNYEPVYYQERPRYVVINDAYAPIVYTRPVVDVRVAPPAFHGEIMAAGPGWRGGAAVAAPAVAAGVYVAVPPPPTVQVGVGLNIGGPPTVVERREFIEVRDRHDHGRHNGWYKHGGPPPPPHGGWRGNGPPPPQSNWRGNPPPPPQGGWRGNGPAPQQGGWRGNGPAAAPAGSGGGGWKGNGGGGKHGGGWKR